MVIKSAKDFQDNSIGVNKFKDSANVASTATNKLSSSFKNLALSVGNALIFAAISAALSYVIKEINDYINRLDIAKDKLSETTSELESVESEIDSISSKIKDLESSGPLSLTDKEQSWNIGRGKISQVGKGYIRQNHIVFPVLSSLPSVTDV